jgi:integrase
MTVGGPKPVTERLVCIPVVEKRLKVISHLVKQQLLGHLDQTTTQRYAHLASDALRKASNKVSEQIEKAIA